MQNDEKNVKEMLHRVENFREYLFKRKRIVREVCGKDVVSCIEKAIDALDDLSDEIYINLAEVGEENSMSYLLEDLKF